MSAADVRLFSVARYVKILGSVTGRYYDIIHAVYYVRFTFKRI